MERVLNSTENHSLQRFFTFFLFGLSLLVLAWILLQSTRKTGIPFLSITEVRIETEWPLTPNQVKSWLPKIEGRNIFSVSADELIQELSHRGWVGDLTIKKEFPNRIYIRVISKKAIAVEIAAKNSLNFIDDKGEIIDRVSPALLYTMDLPAVRFNDATTWDHAEAMKIVERLQSQFIYQGKPSEFSFDRFPIFRVFLSRPKWEVVFDNSNWENQVPGLLLLAHNPPSRIQRCSLVNLLQPKKAVVSCAISK